MRRVTLSMPKNKVLPFRLADLLFKMEMCYNKNDSINI